MKIKLIRTARSPKDVSLLDASKREEILNAAQRVFADVGFKEATIRQICKQAHANVCLISYYFGGKEELYQAIFQRAGSRRDARTRDLFEEGSLVDSAADFKSKLQLYMEKIYGDLISNPDFFKLMGREMVDGLPRAEEIIKNHLGDSHKSLVNFLEYGKKRKFLKKDVEPRLVSLAIINIFTGFVNMQLLDKNAFFFKGLPAKELPGKILKTAFNLVFDGVLT